MFILQLHLTLLSIDIPVPCFPPEKCSSCQCKGYFESQAGDQNIALVTKDGNKAETDIKLWFDVYFLTVIFVQYRSVWFKIYTIFLQNCEFVTKPTVVNYITSGFWPGDPQNMSYLISADLLRFWYLTKHNMPGTSMNKFIETLETLSYGLKPVKCNQYFSLPLII